MTPAAALAAAGLALALVALASAVLAAPRPEIAFTSGNPSAGTGPESGGAGPGGQPAGATAAAAALLVDVTGAVRRPGVYELAAGSRVIDAIRAAGGFGPDVDTAAVDASMNLASPIADGAKVHVPRRGEAAAPALSESPGPTGDGSGSAGSGIDLNTATAEQLDTLPGIGPATAAKILASRSEQPFASVDDLLSRKLVRSSVLEQIRGLVRIGP